MTVVLSIASESIITVTVDSAVINEFQDHREYDTMPKAWMFPRVCCVATWGTRNKIGTFLHSQAKTLATYSVDDVAALVDDWLRNDYKPHEAPLDDVGYHIAGFDQQGKPRVHHVVWGIRRPPPATGPNPRLYHWSHLHPGPGEPMSNVVEIR